MSTCRAWLKAVHATAPRAAVKKFRNAAVLGDSGGYTVELHDGTQFDMGSEHCKYCARANALSKLSTAETDNKPKG